MNAFFKCIAIGVVSFIALFICMAFDNAFAGLGVLVFATASSVAFVTAFAVLCISLFKPVSK